MKTADLVKRVDQLVSIGRDVQLTKVTSGDRVRITHVLSGPMTGFRTACLSFIDRVYGGNHVHFRQFTDKTDGVRYGDTERAIAILMAIRDELEGGWLFELRSLVASELFADFLEQADHLLEQGYKDAAAVMIGSVLEEHLRQLCLTHDVETDDLKDEKRVPRKADRLNSELVKASVYTQLEAKQVTAWLALRNSAAHGEYSLYTAEHVRHFAAGVPAFITRNP